MIKPWSASGFWPPFPNPVEVPSTDVDATPLAKLCFNADWQPYILGAIKVLARPETWVGTVDDIKRVTSQAQSLFTDPLLSENCDACPEFVFVKGGTHLTCGEETSGNLFFSGSGTCAYDFVCYGNAVINPLYGVARAKLVAHDHSAHLVGGNCHKLHMFQTDGTVGNVFTIQWYDCFDTLNLEVYSGSLYTKSDFVAQEICITSLAAFSYLAEAQGEIVCTSA